jgi:hypothetical protein
VTTRTARLLHAAVAALAWAALGIDVSTVLLVEPEEPASLLSRYVDLFSYFTILSTVLVAVVSTALAVDPARDGRAFRVLRLDAVLCIALTGAVYHLLLADSHEVQGVSVVSDLVEHTLLPVATVAVWLLVGPRPRSDLRTAVLSAVLPLVWVAWTFARGAVLGAYPYPFLDGSELGAGAALANTGAVALAFLALAGLATAVDRALPTAPRSDRLALV